MKPILKKLDENTRLCTLFPREILREDLKTILKGIKKPDGDTYDIYDDDGLKIYTTINPRMQEYAEDSNCRMDANYAKIFKCNRQH